MYIFFDLDSTLCSIEWCDILAEEKGIGEQVAKITQATMDGTMDFDEAFLWKLDMIAPSYTEVQKLGSLYIDTLTPGLQSLIEKLQRWGHHVGIITQGYDLAAKIVGEFLWLDMDLIYGIELLRDERGNYRWPVPQQVMLWSHGKRDILQELREKKRIDSPCIMIGDSVSDLKTEAVVDTFIWCGFHVQRDVVLTKAPRFVSCVDELEEVIRWVGRTSKCIKRAKSWELRTKKD